MNRYEILRGKELPSTLDKLVKGLSKDTTNSDQSPRDETITSSIRRDGTSSSSFLGGQNSSAFIDTRRALADSVQGEMGSQGITVPQDQTGRGFSGVAVGSTGALQLSFSTRQPVVIEDGGHVGLGSPPDPALHITGEGSSLRVQGSGSGSGFQVQRRNPADEPAFFVAQNSDGTIVSTGPVSQFFTLTGPNGHRLMIPLRRFNYIVTSDDENNNSFNISMSQNEARSMQEDILTGMRRIGLM